MHKQDAELIKKNQRTGLLVLAIIIGMVFLAFASVPLYRLFCQMTGLGGTAYQSEQAKAPDVLNRKIRILFNTDVNPNLPWSFKPDTPSMTLNIGQEGMISFKAVNQGGEDIAGTALYNVSPPKAGVYFHKTQCFCFNYQLIKPGKEVHFPVVFFLDPEMDKDPELKGVETITLSYTFFKADSPALDKALEAFYKSDEKGYKSVPMTDK